MSADDPVSIDVRVDVEGHGELTVSDAPHHRLDLGALEHLLALAAELHADPPRSLVLRGGPKAFCVGVDPMVFVARRTPFALVEPAEAGAVVSRFGLLLSRLSTLPCPTVAAVVGPALGGGFELALACDVRVAAPTTTFALPEVRLGLLPGGGATQRLTRFVGPAITKDLVLTGRRLRGEDAAALGLVAHLVDRSEVRPRAAEAARAAAADGAWRLVRQNWK